MNIFRTLFKKTAKPTKQDPVFGRIEFSSDHGIDMWCHIPTGKIGHMIIVDAPLNGPSQVQRDFYSALQSHLKQHIEECKTYISAQNNPPHNLAAMTIYSVEVGSDDEIDSGKFVVELCDSEANEIYRVEFNHGRPEKYGVDD